MARSTRIAGRLSILLRGYMAQSTHITGWVSINLCSRLAVVQSSVAAARLGSAWSLTATRPIGYFLPLTYVEMFRGDV